MCFQCRDHYVAIGWLAQDRPNTYSNYHSWGNTVKAVFNVKNLEGLTVSCRTIYRKKEDEILFPIRGQYHLMVSNFAESVADHMIHLPTRNYSIYEDPDHQCDDPEQPETWIIEVNEVIARNYVSGVDQVLLATNGKEWIPEDDPNDKLSQLMMQYMKHFINGGNIPARKF